MKIKLIAIGCKMPTWVNTGMGEYLKRLPQNFKLELIEISTAKRTKHSNIQQVIENEGYALLNAASRCERLIALDEKGDMWSTLTVAKKLEYSFERAEDVAFFIGGPDGLSTTLLEQCHETWSLSALTLPHPLVRLMVSEQIYRAWSLLTNHPYHRE